MLFAEGYCEDDNAGAVPQGEGDPPSLLVWQARVPRGPAAERRPGAEQCSLAVLERRQILAFFERHPGAWLSIVNVLCDRLRRTDEHLTEVAFLQLPTRLAKALLRGVSGDDRPLVRERANQIQLSQRELGNLVGAARESVNKCLRVWQDEGIISITGSVITIKNRTALEGLANLG